MEPLLEVGPLSCVERERPLYHGVYLRLFPGDFVHLKGPSGSGKTTLLRQIVGLEPSQARRFLAGKSYSLSQIADFRRRCLYLAPEAPMVEGDLARNLFFPFRFRKNRTKKHKDPEKILKSLGLNFSLKTRVANLSTGERKRLALARALIFDPEIILADEPFSGLDEENFKKAFKLLYEFSQREKKAVLCVSHGKLPFCTRALTLCEGKLKEGR